MDEMYLFSWNEIPGNDDERLRTFIMHKYNVGWVKTAKLEKIDGNSTIRVFTKKNSFSLKLNDEKNKVNLKIDDFRTGEFDAKAENGKLNIYTLKQSQNVKSGKKWPESGRLERHTYGSP